MFGAMSGLSDPHSTVVNQKIEVRTIVSAIFRALLESVDQFGCSNNEPKKLSSTVSKRSFFIKHQQTHLFRVKFVKSRLFQNGRRKTLKFHEKTCISFLNSDATQLGPFEHGTGDHSKQLRPFFYLVQNYFNSKLLLRLIIVISYQQLKFQQVFS